MPAELVVANLRIENWRYKCLVVVLGLNIALSIVR